MMKKTTKFLSIILSVIMITSCVPFVTYAESNSETFVLSEEHYKAAAKLKAIGIIENIDESVLSSHMTRRDCARLMIKFLNIPIEVAENNSSPYVDVAPSSVGAAEIKLLYEMGYISRGEDLRFYPEKVVSLNEAIGFVVKAMGYKTIAESKGGYPAGYLNVASQYDLLKKINPKAEGIRFCEMYSMIAKALEAPAYAFVGSVGDNNYYSNDTGNSILSEYWGMYYVEGVVTADEVSQLEREGGALSENQIAINNVVYEMDRDVLADYLGKSVQAIIKKNSDEDDFIIYIEENAKKNNYYTLQHDELLLSKTTNRKIAYTTEEKEKYLDLDVNCNVIYNGANWGGYYNLIEALPSYGYVETIDNDNDGYIDVLRVTDFKNVWVSYVDTYNKIICDRKDSSKDIDYSQILSLRLYDAKTKLGVSIESLTYGDILTVAVSKNKKVVTGYVSKEAITGQVTEVLGGTTTRYTINGEQYEVASSESLSFGLGANGTFRIDYLGKIASFEVDKQNQDGYVNAILIGLQDNGGFKGCELKLFNQDNTFSILNVAEKIKLDNLVKDLSLISTKNTISSHVGELVRYKVTDGKVSDIDFAHITNYEIGETGETAYGTLTQMITGDSIERRSSLFCTGGQPFYMSVNEKSLFLVPEDINADESCFVVTTPATYISSGHYYRATGSTAGYYHKLENLTVTVYNLGLREEDCDEATIVVMKSSDFGPRGSASSAKGSKGVLNVVTDITDVYNEESGTSCKRIYFNNGCYRDVRSSVVYENEGISTTLESLNLKPGDVISFTESGNVISRIEVLYRGDINSSYPMTLTDVNSISGSSFQSSNMYGVAKIRGVDISKKVISYTTLDGTKRWIMNYTSPTVLMVRDNIDRTHSVESISVNALKKDDTIVFYSNNSTCSMIVVYR